MFVHQPKTHYVLEYWKTIDIGHGVSFLLVPKQTYEYTEPSAFKDRILDMIKEHDLNWKIIEISEKLMEQSND